MKGFAINLFLVALFIFSMTSCGKNYYYQESHELKDGKWTSSDALTFHFEISDTTQVYDFLLGIQHSLNYPCQNIYLQINAKFPSGHIDKQIRTFDLANKAGTWFGDCDKNGCEFVFPIQKSTFFKEVGHYTFEIKPYMRVDTLKVDKVSLFLEKK